MSDTPHTQRQNELSRTVRRDGWLKNGNPPGDPSKAPRCGAKTRKGTPCQSPAMKNGRCRMHGGKSTGARTPEGKLRSQRGNMKHGRFSKKVVAYGRLGRKLFRVIKELDKLKRQQRRGKVSGGTIELQGAQREYLESKRAFEKLCGIG